MRRCYIFLSTTKPIVNLILRRGQRGPILRRCLAISTWADSVQIERNFQEESSVDHFMSFAEMVRSVRRGYDLSAPRGRVATLHHLDKRRRHSHYADVFAACDFISVVSNEWRRHLVDIEGVDPAKIRVIYNGAVAPGQFQEEGLLPMVRLSQEEKLALRQEFGIPAEAFVVGHLGRDDEPRKDCETFYKAMDTVGSRFFPIFLEASKYGGISELRSAGFQRYRDFYNVMDAYVITSVVEGGPLGFIEATACGVPVVSSRVGMSLDFCLPDLLFDLRDSDGLVACLDEIKGRRNEFEERTQQLATQLAWLNWQWVAKEYEKIYNACSR